MEKYYLKSAWQDHWEEVTQEQFIQAERAAGFYPKHGCGSVATAGFSGGSVMGMVVYGKPSNSRNS